MEEPGAQQGGRWSNQDWATPAAHEQCRNDDIASLRKRVQDLEESMEFVKRDQNEKVFAAYFAGLFSNRRLRRNAGMTR